MRHILLLLFLTSTSFGQSFFFDKGTSGLSLGYGYSANSATDNHNGSLAFTINGIVDLGISFAKSTGDTPEIDGTSYLPSLGLNFRTKDKLGGLRLSVGYLSSRILATFTDPYFRQTVKLEIAGPVLGADAAAQVMNNDKIAVLLMFGLAYGFMHDDNGASTTTKSLSIEVPIRLIGKAGFFISPGLGINLEGGENAFNFGLSAGLLLEFFKKDN